MNKKLVFIDCETTGLDPNSDKMVELTYAVNEDVPKTLYFGIKKVPAFIDDLTKFTARGVHLQPRATVEEATEFIEALRGNTMVGANPAFDKAFMEKEELFTAHYRMLCVESYAMAKLNLDFMPSMYQVFTMLSERGYKFTEPDHSSLNDVLFMREAFLVLRYQI